MGAAAVGHALDRPRLTVHFPRGRDPGRLGAPIGRNLTPYPDDDRSPWRSATSCSVQSWTVPRPHSRRSESDSIVTRAFLTLVAPSEAETRVRASRFLAYAFPATTEDDARAILHEREKRFFDARHHCAAWRLRSGGWRAIDAGEPSGSAGTPILAAIDSRGLADVGVVVTRYFGGTKLGIGGLARAYGEAAAAALDSAPIARAIPADRLEIRYPYSLTHVMMRSLERFPAREVEHGTSNDGSQPVVRLTLPVSEVDAFASSLRDRSGGELVPRKVGEGLVLDLVRGAG